MKTHPQHHFKYCPRCKADAIFNNDNLSLKCPKCGFHTYMNSAAAVTAIIFNENGELLFTRRGVEPSYGKLDLPGGFVDPGENAETAMLREIKEELDLEPEKIEYYCSIPNNYEFTGCMVYTLDLYYKCTITDLSNIKFRDDIIGLEWIKPEDIDMNEVPFDSVKKFIKKLVAS